MFVYHLSRIYFRVCLNFAQKKLIKLLRGKFKQVLNIVQHSFFNRLSASKIIPYICVYKQAFKE